MYDPKKYPYPYYANVSTPIYNPDLMSRNQHGQDQQIVEALLAGIKREASAIALYRRLASVAPYETHKKALVLH